MVIRTIKKLIPHSLTNTLWHYPQAVLAKYYYRHPARKLTMIGIAGTKGKSTTCHLIARILEQAGYRVGMLSTTTIKCGKNEQLNHLKMTTPSVWFLQKFLAYCVTQKMDYVVLEVSSHALKQYRTYGIPFHTVLITNLTPDHQEYHPTPFDYQATHRMLLTPILKTLVLNGDDPDTSVIARSMATKQSPGTPEIVSLREISRRETTPRHGGACNDMNIVTFHHGTELAKWLESNKLPFLTGFNIYNGLAAATVAESLEVGRDIIKRALENPGTIPGRLEEVNEGQSFKIIIDYAHSPVSLKALFEALEARPRNKTIVVFGACGERDPKTRPLMGSVLDHHTDIIIVTNDDPYGENPEKIASELISGIKHKTLVECHPDAPQGAEGSLQAALRDSSSPPEADPQNDKRLYKILDRRTAITKALSLAKPGDLVLILGKGAEQLQVIGRKKILWDDRAVVRELLGSMLRSSTSKGSGTSAY